MKSIKKYIDKSNTNLCTFNAQEFNHEDFGLLLIRLGESLHAFGKAHEFTFENLKNSEGNMEINIRIKDSTGKEYFNKSIISEKNKK